MKAPKVVWPPGAYFTQHQHKNDIELKVDLQKKLDFQKFFTFFVKSQSMMKNMQERNIVPFLSQHKKILKESF